MNRTVFFLATLWLVLYSFWASAQFEPAPVVKSEVRENINGRTYFVHTVTQGQTLYSIARAYEVTPSEIAIANPKYTDLLQVVRLGQVLRIPAAQPARGERSAQHVASGTGGQESRQPRQVNSYNVVTTEFFEHKVARRETLFGIARKHGVTQEDILQHNPEARNGLRFKQILRIPVRKTKTVEYFYHTVAPGETQFGLANRFGITIEELSELNPETIQLGLQAGQRIRVPARNGRLPNGQVPPESHVYHAVEPAAGTDPYCLNPQLKPQYNVALLIPLFLDQFSNASISINAEHQSFTFLPYYQGVLIALDSIRQKGIDITLHVFDVARDLSAARGITQRAGFENMDLIIGPFYPETITFVAGFGMRHGIPVVSPLLDDPALLKGFSNLFQVTPSLETQIANLGKYISKTFSGQNIILVHNNQPQAQGLIKGFKESMGERNLLAVNQGEIPNQEEHLRNRNALQVKEVVFRTSGMSGLANYFDRSKENVLVTLIDGEAFLSNYLRELNQLSPQFNITVFGIPQWSDYQTIDPRYLETLKVHIFTPEFIDYSEPHIRDFVYRYREVFKTEPSDYAFLGVQTGYFFFNAIGKYGKEFSRCINKINVSDFTIPFGFERLKTKDDGWENTSFNLFRYQGFRKVNVFRQVISN